MAIRADELIDRRRLRRKLTFWRIAALVVVALVVVAGSVWLAGDELGKSGDHIAKVKIEGTITEDDELIERLEKIRKSAAVKGVILSIDSPGGTTAGGEAIFDEVRLLAAEKPVTAQVGTLAASAGYMIASGRNNPLRPAHPYATSARLREVSETMPAPRACSHANMVFLGFVPVPRRTLLQPTASRADKPVADGPSLL